MRGGHLGCGVQSQSIRSPHMPILPVFEGKASAEACHERNVAMCGPCYAYRTPPNLPRRPRLHCQRSRCLVEERAHCHPPNSDSNSRLRCHRRIWDGYRGLRRHPCPSGPVRGKHWCLVYSCLPDESAAYQKTIDTQQ